MSRRGRRKRPHALILVGLVLGTFGYMMFLLFVPFIVGPWAFGVAVALGVIILLAARRHMRRLGRRPHMDLRLGIRRPSPPSEDSLETTVAVMFLFGVFVAALFVLGFLLQSRYSSLDADMGVALVGGAIVMLASYLATAILAERDPAYVMNPLPWIVEDTTDDK
jgi:MFS family permease